MCEESGIWDQRFVLVLMSDNNFRLYGAESYNSISIHLKLLVILACHYTQSQSFQINLATIITPLLLCFWAFSVTLAPTIFFGGCKDWNRTLYFLLYNLIHWFSAAVTLLLVSMYDKQVSPSLSLMLGIHCLVRLSSAVNRLSDTIKFQGTVTWLHQHVGIYLVILIHFLTCPRTNAEPIKYLFAMAAPEFVGFLASLLYMFVSFLSIALFETR